MNSHIPMLALLAAACGSNPVEEPGTALVRAVIKYEDNPVVIDLPETAEVGEPVTIAVRSWGLEHCGTKGPTRVTDLGSRLIVEPFDGASRPGTCGSAIPMYRHEATVTFSVQGMVFVAFRGREWPENKPYSTWRGIFVH